MTDVRGNGHMVTDEEEDADFRAASAHKIVASNGVAKRRGYTDNVEMSYGINSDEDRIGVDADLDGKTVDSGEESLIPGKKVSVSNLSVLQ